MPLKISAQAFIPDLAFANFFRVVASRNPFPIPLVYEGRVQPITPRRSQDAQSIRIGFQTQYALDGLGAEPLAGSGFENEQTDPDFDPEEVRGEEV